MNDRKYRVYPVLALLAGLLMCGSASRAEDEKTADTKGDDQAEMSEGAKAVLALRTANDLAEYGRQKKAPDLLLAAARVIGTTAVQPGDENQKAAAEDSTKRAEALIKEAEELVKGLPESEQATIEGLIKSTRRAIASRERSPVGGPKVFEFKIPPGGAAPTMTVGLVGGGSVVSVQRVKGFGQKISLAVVGALTGKVYGQDGPNGGPSVAFQHLPVAKVNIIVRNEGKLPVTVQVFVN